MKRLGLLLLVIFTVGFCFGQTKDSKNSDKNAKTFQLKIPQNLDKNPSYYMVQSVKFQYSAGATAIVSGASAGLGYYFNREGKRKQSIAAYSISGIGGVASMVCYFLGVRNHHKAAMALELIQDKNSIGIAYNF